MQVRENPGLVDAIYIIDPTDPSRYFLATLTDYSAEFKGYTRAEVASLTANAKGNNVEGAEANLTIRLNKYKADEEAGLTTRGKPARRSKVDGPVKRATDTREDRSTTLALPAPALSGGSATSLPLEAQPKSADSIATSATNGASTVPAPAATTADAKRPGGLKATVMNKHFQGDESDLE